MEMGKIHEHNVKFIKLIDDTLKRQSLKRTQEDQEVQLNEKFMATASKCQPVSQKSVQTYISLITVKRTWILWMNSRKKILASTSEQGETIRIGTSPR